VAACMSTFAIHCHRAYCLHHPNCLHGSIAGIVEVFPIIELTQTTTVAVAIVIAFFVAVAILIRLAITCAGVIVYSRGMHAEGSEDSQGRLWEAGKGGLHGVCSVSL
jgi:hypothetical protein